MFGDLFNNIATVHNNLMDLQQNLLSSFNPLDFSHKQELCICSFNVSLSS